MKVKKVLSFEKENLSNNYWGNRCSYDLYLGDNPRDRIFLGRCGFSFNDNDKSVYIANLDIESKYQQQGYGTILLYEVLKDMSDKGFRRVELTDASDRCRKKKNIYRLMGLCYKVDYDGEMQGNIRHIVHGKRKRRLSRMEPYRMRKKPKITDE